MKLLSHSDLFGEVVFNWLGFNDFLQLDLCSFSFQRSVKEVMQRNPTLVIDPKMLCIVNSPEFYEFLRKRKYCAKQFRINFSDEKFIKSYSSTFPSMIEFQCKVNLCGINLSSIFPSSKQSTNDKKVSAVVRLIKESRSLKSIQMKFDDKQVKIKDLTKPLQLFESSGIMMITILIGIIRQEESFVHVE